MGAWLATRALTGPRPDMSFKLDKGAAKWFRPVTTSGQDKQNCATTAPGYNSFFALRKKREKSINNIRLFKCRPRSRGQAQGV